MPGVVSTSIAREARPGRTERAVDRGRRRRPSRRLRDRIAATRGFGALEPPARSGLAALRQRADVAAGLFELRKDAITGWWVATVVDRAFHRDRFARRPRPVDDGGDCQNCRVPAGDGVRLRTLKDFAFHVVGTEERGPRARRERRPGRARAGARVGQLADGRRAAARAPAAPRRRHRRSIGELLAACADGDRRRRDGRADRLPPGRPELGRPGRRPDEPPLPRPVRPAPDPASDRRGARRRGAVRHPRGRVPVVPARPRRAAPPRAARLAGRRRGRLRAVRVALAVRGLGRAAPPRRRLRRATRRRRRARRPRRCARCSAGCADARRPAVQPRPPHRAAPRAGRRDVPLALGDPSAPARDRRPRARDGPAGQPGLARGRGRGAAADGPADRTRREASADERGAAGGTASHVGGRLVSGATERAPIAALRSRHASATEVHGRALGAAIGTQPTHFGGASAR